MFNRSYSRVLKSLLTRQISYNGKSTGAGALSVWTHHLKSIDIFDWNDSSYSGKAIKMGAGVVGFEAMAAAKAEGLVPVGGECSTVGVAGGYTQGGGHSALSTSFGLGADQTLSFEVVTADGCVVTASRTENCDLYWALSGGGGGTYGVVVSMTVKAHPDATVSGASLVFLASSTTADNFYAGIEKFHSLLPAMVDAGSMVVYYFSDAFFQIGPLTAYNKTSAEVKTIMGDLLTALDGLQIPYTASYTQSATYTEHYNTYFGPLPYGNINVGIAQYGGRLIPRATIQNNTAAFMQMARNITQDGVLFIGVGTDVSAPAETVYNSVLPAWRSTLVHATLTTPWNFTAPWADMLALQDKMTDSIMPQIEAVTPGSGAYMNEADFRQPNYQEVFFGSNYDKLLNIKNKWDPYHLFYAIKSVGSDYWNVAADGRMCSA
jgi:FAD/FMN-containing dehydrogenase